MSKVPATKAGIAFRAAWYDTVLFRDEGFDAALAGQSEVDLENLSQVDLHAKLDVWEKEPDAESPHEALVRLTMMIQPLARPSYRAQVAVIGRFAAEKHATIPLQEFVWTNGIAYLVPFLREKLAQLTTASRYEAFILPPLDVADLVELIKASQQSTDRSTTPPRGEEPQLTRTAKARQSKP